MTDTVENVVEEIIEIGEPELPEITVTDADSDTVTHSSQTERSGTAKKYGSESLAKGFVGMMAMGSMAASKRTGSDLNMEESEAEELHGAMKDFGDSLGGVDLPPWLVLLLVTATYVGGRYASFVMDQEKVVNGESDA